jgi:hypothetical protein
VRGVVDADLAGKLGDEGVERLALSGDEARGGAVDGGEGELFSGARKASCEVSRAHLDGGHAARSGDAGEGSAS